MHQIQRLDRRFCNALTARPDVTCSDYLRARVHSQIIRVKGSQQLHAVADDLSNLAIKIAIRELLSMLGVVQLSDLDFDFACAPQRYRK